MNVLKAIVLVFTTLPALIAVPGNSATGKSSSFKTIAERMYSNSFIEPISHAPSKPLLLWPNVTYRYYSVGSCDTEPLPALGDHSRVKCLDATEAEQLCRETSFINPNAIELVQKVHLDDVGQRLAATIKKVSWNYETKSCSVTILFEGTVDGVNEERWFSGEAKHFDFSGTPSVTYISPN